MKASIVFALFALCLLELSARPALQQAPKARVEGSIVRAGNGDAVARARVTLNRYGRGAGLPAPTVGGPPAARGANPQLQPIPPVMTDDQGKFAIPDVDEGSYTLTIQANGYVSTNYGQHFVNGPGVPIVLKAGQSLKDLSIRLTPASTISGRIRDAADQSLSNVPVQLLRYSYNAQGQRSYQAVGSARTNDHGEYRIFWMTPGRYYLMAGNPSAANPLIAMMLAADSGNPTPNDVPVNLSYSFYPGVAEIRAAQPIELQPGADLVDVNMILTAKPPSFRIRGKLIDARTGMPPAQARVGAVSQAIGPQGNSPLDQISMELSLNSYNPTSGAFEIRDLQSGNYVVTAQSDAIGPGARGSTGSTPPPGPSIGTANVAVANADVDGVAITVIPPATLPGRVRAEGTLPIPLERMGLQLSTQNPSPSTALAVQRNGTNATPAADGSFNFAGVSPGEYRVALQARGAPPPTAGARPGSNAMYIKEARFDGNDALNAPIKITGPISSLLEIVIGVGGGQLTGTVTDRRSQPVPVAQIVLVPDRTRDRVELFRTTTSDENGKFTLSGIIPGDYKVFSWEGLEQYSWFDPNLLAQSEPNGKAVHVTDQSADIIDVKFIPKEGAQ